jgi:cytochrome c nitrite reductase small subunit
MSFANPNRSRPASETGAAEIGVITWLAVGLAVVLGVLAGIGTFTFGYAKGFSYLSNDPTACTNCHVMQDYYDSWVASSHHHVAKCNDCHLPHSIAGKYFVKADNGFFHSLAFTTDNFHEPIQIKGRNRRVAENACIDCHRDFVHSLLPATSGGEALSCTHCHLSAGHGP